MNYILGIDPGYDRLGVCVFDCNLKKIVFSSCITPPKKLSDNERVFEVYKNIDSLIKKYKANLVGIEKLYFSKNKKTASFVYQTIGAIKVATIKNKIDILELNPQKIKLSITGYGKSDKKSVYFMLKKQIKVPDNLIDDEVDAIAIAYTTCFYKKNNRIHLST